MSAARFTIEGGAVEVAARFETEGEIEAFIDDLWRIWFVTHPEPDQAERPPAPENFYASGGLLIDLPPLRGSTNTAVMAGKAGEDGVAARAYDPAVHESNARAPYVDARHKAGHDAGEEEAARETNTAVMAGLDPAIHKGGHDAGEREAAKAFASLTAQQRRAVLLKRKLGKTGAVAAEMGVTDAAVYQHLSAARGKGVAI